MTLFDTAESDRRPRLDLAVDEAASPTTGVEPGCTRVRLVVAYDGSEFRGFAAQPDVVTVGGTLIATIARVTGVSVELTCAGRTDAGVHAWGQVCSFDLPDEHATPDGLNRLRTSLNRLCGPAVVVRSADAVAPTFDARFSATWRSYRYTVLVTDVPDPFRARTVWHVSEPLDLRAMTLACDPLIGEHDFASFCRAAQRVDGSVASTVRRVHDARWVAGDDGTVQFRVRASSFCHQMVRSLVGTLVEVGRGKRRAGEMMGIIAARDRHAAGQIAPPGGLCLWEVGYPSEP